MTVRFNPPPNWPPPPAGWAPPANWQPDPGWPPAPAGWSLWVDDNPIAPVAPAAPSGPVTIAATSQGDDTHQPVPGPAPVPLHAPPIPMVQPAKASSGAGEAMGPFGKSKGPDIAVGDIVAQRCHYVFGESGGTLTDGPDHGFEGTRWRVKEIAEQQYRDIGSGLKEQAREPFVELELVEGVYQYLGSFDESELPEGLAQRLIMMAKGKTFSESPGFIMQLVSSNAYRRNHPDQGSNQQFFEEWQKASGDLAGKDPIRQVAVATIGRTVEHARERKTLPDFREMVDLLTEIERLTNYSTVVSIALSAAAECTGAYVGELRDAYMKMWWQWHNHKDEAKYRADRLIIIAARDGAHVSSDSEIGWMLLSVIGVWVMEGAPDRAHDLTEHFGPAPTLDEVNHYQGFGPK